MSMNNEPIVKTLDDGSTIWKNAFNTFEATVYSPKNPLPGDVINYGFISPYLLVFAENQMDENQMISQAKELGLEALAASYDSSVVFISPVNGDWDSASPDIFSEIISNSKIHEYHKDGYVINVNRFNHKTDGYFIRGAIFRTCLFGFGKSADYIAKNCLKHFEGDGLWGRSDLAPVTCILSKLSAMPDSELLDCKDIPVISYGNSEEINKMLGEKCAHFVAKDNFDFTADFDSFAKKFRRMNGPLMQDPDLEKDGLVIEPSVITVGTSKDNCGDDKGTETHKLGYIAFYNKDIINNEKLPLVLGFHGGGDSCFFLSTMAGWAKICHRHDFLFVAVENHLNSTATEMIELVEHLMTKYPIDETRIYASGFSMGGCKSWDLVQEYPELLAAVAPMDATFEVGLNVYGMPVQKPINETVAVPTFYTGGEITPLPELPFQAQKCLDRMGYILKVNKATAKYDVKLEDKDNWANKIWGIDGDITEKFYDESRDATLTLQMFKNVDSKIYNIFGSISGQGHDCREHTCEHAWRYMRNFSRTKDGVIHGGEVEEILKSLKEE